MPVIVNVLGNRLTFDEYKKGIYVWGDRCGSFYEKYKIERSSRLFRSTANNYVVNEFIDDVIFSKLAGILSIEIGAEEKNDVIFGENIDDKIRRSFVDEDGRFDRSRYNRFIQTLENDVRLKAYWDNEVKLIMKNRRNNKVKDILDGMSSNNLLEIKRKFVDKNSSYDIVGVFSDIKPEDIDYSKYGKEIENYYNKNNDLFRNEEMFKVKYFINKFDVNDDVKKYNLSILSDLIDKFSISSNPIEVAKVRSDSDVSIRSSDYMKSFYKDELPRCFNSDNSVLDSVVVEFPNGVDGLIKIYRIVNVCSVDGKLRYDVVVMYKKLVVDEYSSDSLYNDIVKRLKNVSSLDEFEEFANESGYKLLELDVSLKTDDVENFENINVLKKELYRVGSEKSEHVLPVIVNRNGLFVGYLCKYLAKGSLKTLDDVRNVVMRKIRKRVEKDRVNNQIGSDVVYQKSIDELRRVKGFVSFSLDGVNLDNIDKKSDRNRFLVREIVKYLGLLDGETRFFKFGDRIVRVRVKNVFNSNFDSDLFKDFVNKNRAGNNGSESYVKIFEKLYCVDKLDYAYNLL